MNTFNGAASATARAVRAYGYHARTGGNLTISMVDVMLSADATARQQAVISPDLVNLIVSDQVSLRVDNWNVNTQTIRLANFGLKFVRAA